jgi:hypothetical protein
MAATESTPTDTRPLGSSLSGPYALSLAACLLGNLLIRMGAQGAWLPTWVPRLDPPDIRMTPAILVAIGIALARRRYQ